MSKCISSHGEYSEHTEVSPDDGVCGYCGDVDLDSIRANAWDEGLREGLDRGWDQAAGAVPDGTPAPKNPYRTDDA